MSRAMVLLHLKAISTLACLNRLVILRVCGEVTVKVAHFVLFPAFVGGVAFLCCIWCFYFVEEGSWEFVVFCNVEDGLSLVV